MHKVFFLTFWILTTTIFFANAQNALEFDGTDDYVQTSAVPPTGNKPRTIECWIRAYHKKTQQVMVDYGAMSPNGSRYTFNMIDGKLRIEVAGTGFTGSKMIADTTWHHIAVTYDNNASPKFRTFIDGAVEDSFTLSINPNTTAGTKLKFGTRADIANFYKGTMDEVRVWDYARNHQQIKNNYQKELCSREKGLVAYHKFNQGTAGKNNRTVDESTDISGKGNNGDLKGFALTGTASNWITGYTLTQGSTTGSAKVSGCGKYKSPSGKTFTKSGTYVDTIDNYMGCDSFVTLSVTVIPNPTQTINATSCKVYISPSGNYAWNKTGTYTDKLTNPNGCDTIVTVNLIVSGRSFSTENISTCGSFTSASGKYTWATSGTYTDTVVSIFGCDSIITTNLEVNSTDTSLSVFSCEPYLSPSGKYTWNKSGVYVDTLPNSQSCDSLITINLTVGAPSDNIINEFSCGVYTSPSGKHIWTTDGTYMDTIINYSGCDSIITINLKMGNRTADFNTFACDEFISPSGKKWTTSGEYTDIIKTKKGCDSIMTFNLIVMPTAYSTASLSGCNKVTSPSGRHIWTTSGTYTDTIFRQTRCDSIITVEVSIDELVNPEIIRVNEKTIEVTETGDAYQWLNCADNFAIIADAESKTFKPETIGQYTAQVSKGQCTDTATCYIFASVNTVLATDLIKLYPNPANNALYLVFKKKMTFKDISVLDLNGKVLMKDINALSANSIDISSLNTGLYILQIVGNEQVYYLDFIKE